MGPVLGPTLYMPEKIKIFVLFLVVFWMGLFITLISVSFNYNAMSTYFSLQSRSIKLLMPEGWGFFTKNPQEPRIYYLVKKDHQWVMDPNTRRANLYNYWGLKKRPAHYGVLYYTQVLKWIPKDSWLRLTDRSFSKLDLNSKQVSPYQIKIAKIYREEFPDQLVIVKRRILPWAFRNFRDQTGDSVMVAKVNLIYE